MVQFAQPFALWLLLVAPLPLVLARRRTRHRQQEVGNLYLWTEARQREREGPSIRRTRRRWSALAQAVVLAAIAIALARPTLAYRGSPSALVIDVSASMDARMDGATRLDLAKAAARRELRALAATRVVIAEASDAPRIVGTFAASDPAAAAAIDGLRVTRGGADVQAALDLLATFGASRAVVISDRAPHADGGQVRVVTVGRPADNVAVTALVASVRQLGRAEGDVVAQVRHFGTTTRAVTVQIDSAGRQVSRSTVTLGPDAVQTVHAHISSLGADVTARIDADDALASDNVRTAVVEDGSRRLRVGYRGRGSGALQAALAALPSIQVVPGAPADGPGCVDASTVDGVDVLVLEGCEPTTVTRPTLVVAPSRGTGERTRATVGDEPHPVTAALALDDASVIVGTPLALERGDVPVLQGGDETFVAASDRAGHRVVRVGIDLSQSPFVLTPGFPVLVANAVEWLGAAATVPRNGTALSEPTNVDASESDLASGEAATPVTLAAGAEPTVDATAWVLLLCVGVLLVEWQLRVWGL